MNANIVQDTLSQRMGELRRNRAEAAWPELLLALARDLTMARAAALLEAAPTGLAILAPLQPGEPPPIPTDWSRIAIAAIESGGVQARPEQGPAGGWLFAVPLGHAGMLATAPRRAALVVEVGSALAMDLALTRERLVLLAAAAEGATAAAAGEAARAAAVAAAAADALLRGPELKAGLNAAALVLAQALPGATRVAIGLFDRGRLQALALSDQPDALPAADLPRRLTALMEESLDQEGPVVLAAGARGSPAARGFTDQFGPRAILAAAAPGGGAAIVAEFANLAEVPAIAAAQVGPSLTLIARAARGRPPRSSAAVRRRRLVGGLATLAVLCALALIPRTRLVDSPFTVQPERQQVIAVPFDGILDASAVQPGDSVVAGETLLARLVTRDLALELAVARARAANDLREAAIARAQGQPAQEQIALLAARRGELQVALLETRLASAEIRAPVDGVIVSGDWRRSLGQPVTRGQVLFEVAPPAALRAEIWVADQRIMEIRPGQAVRLATAAEPGDTRLAIVERVSPMAETVAGRNAFRVIARFEGTPPARWRPGMEGMARVEAGQTSWGASILREPVLAVRRWLWV